MHYYIDVLKKYAVFKGRATRSEYWYFTLFNFIVSIILSVISIIIGDEIGILAILYAFAIVLPSIGVSIRRLHDVGKSGWMMFIALIPIIGGIWLLVLNCTDSTPGDNQYGPNPKGVQTGTPPVAPTATPVQNPPQPEQPTNTQ